MQRVLVIFALFCSAVAFAQTNARQQRTDSLLMIAYDQIGVPYKWATSSPGRSFDCSGFTYYVYDSIDAPSSRSSRAYATLGESVPLDKALPGDCIVFSGTAANSRTPGHVGIITERTEDCIEFIHCSSSKKHFGVVITDYYESNYPKRFLDVRRIF